MYRRISPLAKQSSLDVFFGRRSPLSRRCFVSGTRASTVRGRSMITSCFGASCPLLQTQIPFEARELNWLGHSPRVTVSTKAALSSGPRLKKLTQDGKQRLLKVKLDNGVEEVYPFVWLRDNCQCATCFHPVSKARRMLLCDLDPAIAPQEVKGNENEVVITWPDGHVSTFSVTWLWERRFKEDNQKRRREFRKLTPKLWGAEMGEQIPKADFNEVMTDDRALYNWLCTLEETGIVLVQNAPIESGLVQRFAKRVGFFRLTHYGLHWKVLVKPGPSNLAYTNAAIGLHTDQPYYDYAPGVQLFHFIKQASVEGGDNEFADGFRAAEQLRLSDPAAFKLLCTAPVDYIDEGDDYVKFYKISMRPVITLDANGSIQQINYSNPSRDSHLCIPLSDVQPLYVALRKFDDLLYHKKNIFRIKVKPGEIVGFHNYRVLHGRVGFKLTERVERHMEGGYLDWDELSSRRRVLELEYNFSNCQE